MSSSGDGTGPTLTIEPTLETHAGEYEIIYKIEDSNSERGEEGSLMDETLFMLTIELPEVVEEEEEKGKQSEEGEGGDSGSGEEEIS